MESSPLKESFSPDKIYEEEFDIVPVGEGSKTPKAVHPHSVYWQFAIIILCSTLAFMLGRLALLDSEKPAIRIEQPGAVVGSVTSPSIDSVVLSPIATKTPSTGTSKSAPIPGGFVASKNGTKYYIPTCGGANRIKDENKIWFATKVEAEKAGYAPAANCPGL